MSQSDDEMSVQRQEMFERWECAAAGWGRRADGIRDVGMPVSVWMIEHLALNPGHRVLELASGPGDTGFLAAELIRPGGTLVCSDAAEAMLEIARARAEKLGIDNVEFRRLELEWIDLPTASVDAILCRWGMMLSDDPGTALREARRVLRPGGRLALAVWDRPEENPWATIPGRALIKLGHAQPPEPDAPGMFALAQPGRLEDLLSEAGFVEVVVGGVVVDRNYPDLERYLDEIVDLSQAFSRPYLSLGPDQQEAVRNEIASLATPFTGPDGSVRLPGRSLVAAAGA